jgi:hypothetical protein
MIAAVTAGDASTAGDEVRRLDALDGSDEQFDLDEIEQVVGGRTDDSIDDLRELFDDGGCDIDPAGDDDAPLATTLPVTETTTSPAPSEPPTGTSAPAPGTPAPPFTLPIPTGTTAGPGTSAPPSSSTETTGRSSPASTPPTTEGAAPPPRTEIVEVDVGAIESGDMPDGLTRTPIEAALRYESVGMIIPAAPAMVTDAYVSRGLTYGSTYDSITSVADTEVTLARISSRFRAAISATGDYRFSPLSNPSSDSVGFSAMPTGDGPSWEVDVVPSPFDGLVEIRISKSDFGDTVALTIPDVVGKELRRQLAVLQDLGWRAETVSELRSDLGDGFSSTSVSLTVRSAEPRRIADQIAARLDGAAVEPGPEDVTVTTPDGDWVLSDVSDTDVFVYFSTSR